MRLTVSQIAEVKELTGVEPVPEDHPNQCDLIRAFGDHTFFLDSNGLHVLESEVDDNGDGTQNVYVLRVASWADDDRTALAPHEPQTGQQTLTITADEDGED